MLLTDMIWAWISVVQDRHSPVWYDAVAKTTKRKGVVPEFCPTKYRGVLNVY